VVNSGTVLGGKYTAPALQNAFDIVNVSRMFFSKFGDDFNKTVSLHALYAMLDNKIGEKFRLVWGLRGEYYNLNSVNQALDKVVNDINDSRGGDEQFDFSSLYNREPDWHFFPSANLTYGLTSAMNLRLAYAESIIRPDLRELSFFREYDFELGGAYQSDLVKSTTIRHIDFRYEWYPEPGEIISLSLFYKKFKNPMEIYQVSGQRIYQLQNNKSATNKGLEVEMRKSFAFTGVPVLRNITLYGNFTILDARVTPMKVNFNSLDPNNPLKIEPIETIGEEEKRPQTGASNYMYNAGMYYDTKPVSLSLSYNYVTNRLFRPADIYAASLFEHPLQALDAQVSIRMLKQKGEIKLNAGNLLNSYSVIYQNQYKDNDGNVVGSPENAPTTKDLLYQPDLDIINYKTKSGRTYSITLSYTF
jgi:outer membrane receptor protein involved in Fe transport